MGVHGLWKLIDKAGRPIPIESLENKVLAIDVSIWLYQLVRGFDSSARPGSNMFLLGLFHRICKLLFYRIKPIFVFDGGVPSLKKKTIAARQKGRRKAQESIEKVRQQLLENLIKQQALGDVLGENVKIPKQFASKQDELFWLPPKTEEEAVSRLEEDSDSSEDERLTRKYVGDLNSVDVNSEDFLKLPADVRHDILLDLKETRKLNSWARIHLMPEEADDFSSFQMGRLLKRRAVQVGLDKAADELGVRGFTVNDLENILTEQGIDLSQRIAGDSSTRFIYSSNPRGKQNEQSERSEDEDDVSELVHPSRDLSKAESSDSEDDISPAVQKMASRENGDLSQTEILQLIKQQHGKVSGKDDPDWNIAGTSKSCVSFAGEEESESTVEMGAHDRVNDPTVTRGKHSAGNNEKSKLGPGKLPGASHFPEITTTSQKDTLLWSNQVEGVSLCKNVPGSGNEALEEQKNVVRSNEGVESAGDESADFVGERDDTFVEVSPVCSTQPSKTVASGLEIVIKPEDSIGDDIFADVFSREVAEKSLKSYVEDAVAKSILMLTEIESTGSKSNTNDGIVPAKDEILPKKALEIVIDPKEPIEDDIFADVFSNPLSAKPGLVPDPSESPKSQISPNKMVIEPNTSPKDDILAEISSNPHPIKPALEPTQTESLESKALPKSLEIVIDPNESPDEDIFADVFSHADTTPPKPASKTEEKAVEFSRNESSSAAISSSDDEAKSSELLEITVNPEEPPEDDDLFADVFAKKPETNSQGAIKPSFRKLINDIKNSSSSRDLSDIKNVLEKESQQLAGETKREERLASTITEQITQEAQDLLELFGIPYLVAPMEAEAQCAYLDLTGQTDGTITDDSDIWLFGANNVYKNFFDQKKFVKLFKSSDIHQCYRLNREDLIMIAMLVGSDYTSGLAGVGPVNAIEIVAHFPRSQGAPLPQDRLLKFVDAYVSSEMNQQLFRKLKSIEFTDGFPSDEVVKAYLSPIVDESKEKFSWSKPDLTRIKHFMRSKVGWDFNKTDKTLNPIFEKMNQSTTQKTIHNYFDWAFDVDEVATVSKRVGNAVEILTTGIIPSPTKISRKDEPTRSRTESKDRLVSNYSRRKYGRYQQQEKELENEPVLEGMKAAKAAAKAIMAATRKPVVKSVESRPAEVVGLSTGGSDVPAASASRGRGRPKKDVQDPKDSSTNETVGSRKRKNSTTQDSVAGPSAIPVAPAANAPLPALSDILCGIGSEPAAAEETRLWTPSRDLVSPYAKRKYGKLGQSTAPRRDTSNFAVPEGPRQTFDRVMPSKNPAQIARERAAKKLKEAKLKTAQSKAKKSTSK